MNLNFLTSREAVLELSSSEYLQKMSKPELIVRLHYFYPKDQLLNESTESLRQRLDNLYVDSFEDFDTIEQQTLELYFNKMKQQLEQKYSSVPNITPMMIGLIKLNDRHRRLDWGFLYTLNNSIVVPTGYLETLVTRYHQMNLSFSDTLGPSSSGLPAQANLNLLLKGMGDLYHEAIHIVQRKAAHRSFFETMYKNFFGFKKAKIRGLQLLLAEKQAALITNPDALNFEWITTITINGRHQAVAPTLVYKDKLEEVLFFLEKSENSDGEYRLTGESINLDASYRNRFFGLTRQLHHPNEISAQLLSDYMILGKIWGSDWTNFPFYQYLIKPSVL